MSEGGGLWPEVHGIAIAILVQMIDWMCCLCVSRVARVSPRLGVSQAYGRCPELAAGCASS